MNSIKSILSLSIMLPIVAFATSPSSSDVILKPVDQTVESQSCYIAGTQGLDAAKTYIQENDYSFGAFNRALTCNGVSIQRFARRYAKVDPSPAVVPAEGPSGEIKFVALGDDTSKLCVDAIALGESEARAKHGVLYADVYCNGKTLSSFARRYQNKKISL